MLFKDIIYGMFQQDHHFTTNMLNGFTEQIGGSKDHPVTLKVKYEDHIYEFKRSDEHKETYILYAIDNKNQSCVAINIDTKIHIANIYEITSDQAKCIPFNVRIGSVLLMITIKMIKKYHDKLGIKYLTVTDNSFKRCGSDTLIDLMQMSILCSGDTWYGKYGFRPIENIGDKVKSDHVENSKYQKNKYIMEKIKISDINLQKYFRKLKKENEKYYQIINKIINKKPNMLLKDFLKLFLQDFDINCKIFASFYKQLFKDIGLELTKSYYGVRLG